MTLEIHIANGNQLWNIKKLRGGGHAEASSIPTATLQPYIKRLMEVHSIIKLIIHRSL